MLDPAAISATAPAILFKVLGTELWCSIAHLESLWKNNLQLCINRKVIELSYHTVVYQRDKRVVQDSAKSTAGIDRDAREITINLYFDTL